MEYLSNKNLIRMIATGCTSREELRQDLIKNGWKPEEAAKDSREWDGRYLGDPPSTNRVTHGEPRGLRRLLRRFLS